jgi:hypothetical protein
MALGLTPFRTRNSTTGDMPRWKTDLSSDSAMKTESGVNRGAHDRFRAT